MIRGTVTLERGGGPLHHATVLVVQLSRSVETGAGGGFEFRQVPPGRYEVVAHMHPLSDERRTVEVPAGGSVSVDFTLRLAAVHEEITVTASGREETTLEAFQSVLSIQGLDLAQRASASLGEAIENEAGVAKRSYGPGTSRPVVRGFDGDRVLILQDGLPSGTLSSQSGDHGEPVDVSSVERIEVVRGPATLLYGTNAIGGVVNVLSGHHEIHRHAHQGARGFVTGTAGSNNALGGGNGGFEYGNGKWMLNAAGGGLRTGDYQTPLGTVTNSGTDIKHSAASIGRYSERTFVSLGYGLYDGRYGIPVAPEDEHHHHHEAGEAHEGEDQHEHEHEGPVKLKWRRHNARLAAGFKNFQGPVENFTLNLNYSDWNHKELVEEMVGTEFFNRQFTYRGVFDQRRRGALSGSFGFAGLRRSYDVRGEEAITPPVTQNGFAAFGLESLDFERFRVQLGGRLETNRYNPRGAAGRDFTGFSGSAGVNVPLWSGGAFVASYSNSYRAPAIEELYNVGPHHGNLAYEVGDRNLARERSNGIDLSLRHRTSRLKAEANFFYYRLDGYIYLEPTGEFEDGLVKAFYRQGDSRYLGAEGRLDFALHRDFWLKFAVDSVDAQLAAAGLPLPRIPPLRGRIGVDARRGGFSLRPEVVLGNAQRDVYLNEDPTAGYAVVNLNASYTLARQHTLHSFGVNLFNAGDRFYRNHVSLIKSYAAEIGRGVRVSYTVRFF